MKLNNRQKEIIRQVENEGELSVSEVLFRVSEKINTSLATIKRDLKYLSNSKAISIVGNGKSTKYKINGVYKIIQEINIDEYFSKEIDQREIRENFNFDIFDILYEIDIFTDKEKEKLNNLKNEFDKKIKRLSVTEKRKDMERLAVDLSWKSSEIEGNTYSLLETERLLQEKKTASGKTKEEAVMLFNHKDAIDFLLKNPSYMKKLSLHKMEEIHTVLTKELQVKKGLRKRLVRITGTNYKPLDNEFQIKESVENMIKIINNKENIFEKAFLALILTSYIQPFMDGNKRTARLISNGILISGNIVPLSYRTVESIDYKKAMLVFYENNIISEVKKIFISQVQFATENYV